MTASPPDQLADYELGEQIGAGGMGSVYRARDRRLGRQVALKILTPGELSANAKARLLQEAKMAAAVDHPFVCKVYEAGEVEDTAFIAMEFVEGTTLSDLLKKTTLRIEQVGRLAVETCEALEIAHQIGLAHRDLKPANLLVTAHDHIKLLDFGIAKPFLEVENDAESGDSQELTQPGIVVGTPPYMAPEQLSGGKLDGRTDLFALGVILHEALTGAHPFKTNNGVPLLSNILVGEPPFSGRKGTLSGGWRSLVARLLQKKPEDRYQSAADVRLELNHLLGEFSSSKFPAIKATIPSLAVIPFENLSQDSSTDYFSDGVGEEINLALSRVKNLRVIARTSSFAYRGAKDLQKVAEALDVENLVVGSVRCAGNRVRVSVQLVEPATGDCTWQRSFDSTMEDIFAVQDEVAAAVVEEMRSQLSQSKSGLFVRPVQTTNPTAYAHFLKGRHEVNQLTTTSLENAVISLHKAVEADPDYAPAYSALASIHLSAAFWGTSPANVSYPTAMKLCEEALALDPTESDALSLKATICSHYFWKAGEAEALWQEAIAARPSNALALYSLAIHLSNHGRHEEALELSLQAQDLDPLSPMVSSIPGHIMLSAGRFEDSANHFAGIVEVHPQHPFPAIGLMSALVQLGRFEDALKLSDLVKALPGGGGQALLGCLYAKQGKVREAEQVLKELAADATDEVGSFLARAALQTALGEHDQALDLIDRAIDAKEQVLGLGVNPALSELRVYRRFQKALQRIGLPSELTVNPADSTVRLGKSLQPDEASESEDSPRSEDTIAF